METPKANPEVISSEQDDFNKKVPKNKPKKSKFTEELDDISDD